MPDNEHSLNKRINDVLKGFFINEEGEAIRVYDENNIPLVEDPSIADSMKNYFETIGDFDQLTVNDYMPGQGIPPHIDTHSPFEEIFCSISMNSEATMTFKDLNNEVRHISLKPRSLMIFSGEGRYNWLHSIPTRKFDKVNGLIKSRRRRISLTYRKLRKDPVCKCKWPRMCDSQNKLVAVEENMLVGEGEEVKLDPSHTSTEKPTEIEQKHVYEVYEKIAPHFSKTRYKPWPKVQEFLESLPEGSINCDVGCGNGKYLGVNNKNIFSIGTDRSFNLIGIARELNPGSQNFVCNSLNLSLRSNAFDSVISIAVIHHFSTKVLRIKAIKELKRIVKVGGKILIYVWAYEQERKFTTQDVFVPWHLHDTYDNPDEKSGNFLTKNSH
jgi:alkylated DNA repair protein alkB homolog 8